VEYACGAEIDDEGRFQFSFSESEERGNPSRREKFYPCSCVAAVVLLSTCSELQFRVAVASLYDLPRGKVIQSLAHFLHQGVLIGNPIFRKMNSDAENIAMLFNKIILLRVRTLFIASCLMLRYFNFDLILN